MRHFNNESHEENSEKLKTPKLLLSDAESSILTCGRAFPVKKLFSCRHARYSIILFAKRVDCVVPLHRQKNGGHRLTLRKQHFSITNKTLFH